MSRSFCLWMAMIFRTLELCYLLAVAMLVFAAGWWILHRQNGDVKLGEAIALNLGGIALLAICPFTWLAKYFERKANKTPWAWERNK